MTPPAMARYGWKIITTLENNKNYKPLNFDDGNYSGNNYLGSESDWIIAKNDQYRFGEYYGWREADVVAKYYFYLLLQ